MSASAHLPSGDLKNLFDIFWHLFDIIRPFSHKKLIQGASQWEGADPFWGVQPTRHPSRVSPTIPSSHWCLICAMHNVYALYVDLCNLCSYWCHHLSSCEFAYMHWKPNVRSLCFKSRSNWVSAHVSIFSKLSQGDQMCGQIWAMRPKNEKLSKFGQILMPSNEATGQKGSSWSIQ